MLQMGQILHLVARHISSGALAAALAWIFAGVNVKSTVGNPVANSHPCMLLGRINS